MSFDEQIRALVAHDRRSEPVIDDRILARAMAQPAPRAAIRWQLPAFGFAIAAAAAAVIAIVVVRRPSAACDATVDDRCTTERDVAVTPAGDRAYTFSVDPEKHAPFRVRTPAFTVDVLGTVFEVRARSVHVTRGVVRVTAPDGTILAARVVAGETWALAPEQVAAKDATTPAATSPTTTSPTTQAAIEPGT